MSRGKNMGQQCMKPANDFCTTCSKRAQMRNADYKTLLLQYNIQAKNMVMLKQCFQKYTYTLDKVINLRLYTLENTLLKNVVQLYLSTLYPKYWLAKEIPCLIMDVKMVIGKMFYEKMYYHMIDEMNIV